jgi:hypothetical protein
MTGPIPVLGGRLDVAAAFSAAAGAASFGTFGWAFFLGADFFGAGEDDFFDGTATTSGRAGGQGLPPWRPGVAGS